MSDNQDTTVTTNTAPIDIDLVSAKLNEYGDVSDEVVEKVKALGVSTPEDLAILTVEDLTAAGLTVVAARKLVSDIKAPAADAAVVNGAAIDNLLPAVQDDSSWLEALKTGGVLKVDSSTVTAAIRAALAKRVGLYDLPSRLVDAMEQFAEESEEPVSATYFAIREQITRRSYGDIFSAIPGLNGNYITEKRKNELLSRLDRHLWPAVGVFNSQLSSWYETYTAGASSPLVLMSVLAGNSGQGVLPAGLLQAPDTSAVRDAADAVKDAINKVFAGTGVQITAALASEASEIKKSLENPQLPALIGVANREQLLKKLGVGVPATYPRLETNVTRYILGVISLEDQAAGQEELSYLGALYLLGSQIAWDQLGTSRGGYSTLDHGHDPVRTLGAAAVASTRRNGYDL